MRRVLPIAVALAIGGCGGDDEQTTTPAAQATADPALARRAQDCGLPEPAAGAQAPEDLAGLLPEQSLVLTNEPAGAGYRATAFVGASLVDTLAHLKRSAQEQGYEEEFSEREAIDAELALRSEDGGALRFALSTPSGCEDGVSLTATRIG